jgi:hypothetical protein
MTKKSERAKRTNTTTTTTLGVTRLREAGPRISPPNTLPGTPPKPQENNSSERESTFEDSEGK